MLARPYLLSSKAAVPGHRVQELPGWKASWEDRGNEGKYGEEGSEGGRKGWEEWGEAGTTVWRQGESVRGVVEMVDMNLSLIGVDTARFPLQIEWKIINARTRNAAPNPKVSSGNPEW